MKTFLIITASILFLAAASRPAVDSQAAIAEPLAEVELASSATELAGTWYSTPLGMLIRFNESGSAILGLDNSGEMTGYAADAWFEGTQLSITFRNFTGESSVCRTAVGVYEVHKLASGSIRFFPLSDACEMRSNILGGSPALGFDPLFHPVENVADTPSQ